MLIHNHNYAQLFLTSHLDVHDPSTLNPKASFRKGSIPPCWEARRKVPVPNLAKGQCLATGV